VSIQVAILKVLASHGNGRATLASLRRDIMVLTASGGDWSARLKRLAGRVPSIDIFGSGYVLHDREGWEITTEGREFLQALEAITQDNHLVEAEPPASRAPEAVERPPGELIVVGHRFKSRLRPRPSEALAGPARVLGSAREEGVSKKK
jgi:nucleotide-binding universal stress UspA family protein